MKRCNIFYNCENNNFLTFSNYTEALTGNFLSTDTKLFPSRFLCLNLNGLNETNKQSLVYLLTCYYENKLTVLRNYNSSNSILPLNYLHFRVFYPPTITVLNFYFRPLSYFVCNFYFCSLMENKQFCSTL